MAFPANGQTRQIAGWCLLAASVNGSFRAVSGGNLFQGEHFERAINGFFFSRGSK